MKTFTVTTESGTYTYQADTQGEALRLHTQERPGTGVLGIVESVTYRVQADELEATAD